MKAPRRQSRKPPKPARKIRVFLVDDQEYARKLFSEQIDTDPKRRMTCVGQHERNDDSVIDAMRDAAADIALIDCVLEKWSAPDALSPLTSGFDLMARISRELPEVRILAMSNFPGVEQRSLNAGAHGFVYKDKTTDIMDAIVQVASRRPPKDNSIKPVAPRLVVDVQRRTIQVPARDGSSFPTRKLDPAAFAVLLYLARVRVGGMEPAFDQLGGTKGAAEYQARSREAWRAACRDAGAAISVEGRLLEGSLAKFVHQANHEVLKFWGEPLIKNVGPRGKRMYEIAREFEVEVV